MSRETLRAIVSDVYGPVVAPDVIALTHDRGEYVLTMRGPGYGTHYSFLTLGEPPLTLGRHSTIEWMENAVRRLISLHREPANRMTPWADRLPPTDAMSYLLS